MARILRLTDVIQKTGLSRSTIYHYGHLGIFPKQFKIGLRGVGWLESDVEQWLDAKVQANDVRQS